MRPLALAVLMVVGASGPVAAQDVARGQVVYRAACATCHGLSGDGRGVAAAQIDPPPRDFRTGVFKFRRTASGSLPLDADLARTVAHGIPRTTMPGWRGALSPYDLRAVVAYVKTFSPRFAAANPRASAIVPPPSALRPPAAYSARRGRDAYLRMSCNTCHGDRGRGDGPAAPTLRDDEGRPIAAFDFTDGTYKGGNDPRDVYRTFTTGMDGTPMPSYADLLTESERWDLVRYVLGLTRPPSILSWLLRPADWFTR